MLKVFKKWFEDVEATVIANKKKSAKDPMLWEHEIWASPHKKADIKKKFREEMESFENSESYFSKPRYLAATGEWMYDFVSRRFDNDNNLIEVFLAMEIEMSNPNACDTRLGFNKLLQADARYKIFVFQHNSREDIIEGIIKLKSSAEKYCFRSDSEFLLCGWSASENRFFFDELKAGRVAADEVKNREDTAVLLRLREAMTKDAAEFVELPK